LDTALMDTQAALQSGPPSADLYQLLGSLQLSQGRLPEARDALRRAIYLDPDREESLLQLAIVYQRLGVDLQAARYRKRAARAHQRKAEGSEP
jgi:chemotaxis protein methyltransferase WspC